MKGRVYVEIVVLNKRWFFAGMPDIEKLVRWMDANATQSELLPPILRNDAQVAAWQRHGIRPRTKRLASCAKRTALLA